jgi:histidyl-tRNA synthetase
MGNEAKAAGVKLMMELRRRNVAAETDFTGKSLKSQMKLADKLGASCVLIIGDDEVANGVVTFRDMLSKEQRQVPMADIPAALRNSSCD